MILNSFLTLHTHTQLLNDRKQMVNKYTSISSITGKLGPVEIVLVKLDLRLFISNDMKVLNLFQIAIFLF